MVRNEFLPVWPALLLTLLVMMVVVLGTGFEYASGHEPIAEAWSASPFLKILFVYTVMAGREEMLFRIIPAIFCVTILQAQPRKIIMVGVISAGAYAGLHYFWGYGFGQMFVLWVIGLFLFELCFSLVQTRLERVPLAFGVVFTLHLGYNIALKLLLLHFG